jgi:hypothetical protein
MPTRNARGTGEEDLSAQDHGRVDRSSTPHPGKRREGTTRARAVGVWVSWLGHPVVNWPKTTDGPRFSTRGEVG